MHPDTDCIVGGINRRTTQNKTQQNNTVQNMTEQYNLLQAFYIACHAIGLVGISVSLMLILHDTTSQDNTLQHIT